MNTTGASLSPGSCRPDLQIKPGDYAEVVLPMYPGRVFADKVVTTTDVASEGQLTASGLSPGRRQSQQRALFSAHPPRRCRELAAARRNPREVPPSTPARCRLPASFAWPDAGSQLDQLPVHNRVKFVP
jgi:hypothetical protein